MSGRKPLAQIARETLTILETGAYASPGGEVVSICRALENARAGTVHYTPGDFTGVFERRDHLLRSRPRIMTDFEVVNCSTLAAARSFCLVDDHANILALNFASAKHPGGGFLSGSRAQEESLARSSALYACLAPCVQMYETNRTCGTCLYTDHMIYAPGVPVFRDDAGNLLGEPYLVSFLTAPAVNVGALKPAERSRIEGTMQNRMEKLLSVAAIHGYTTLILGAWGCGAFKNDPAHVARWFHHHMVENPGLAGAFTKVVFAVLDWSADRRFIGPFERQFAAV